MERYFKKADGGTIIIKNVQLLNFEKQSVLLHILENEHPNVRVICTADPDLRRMVSEKTFRPNLFYTLRQVGVTVPPLREVTEDIVPLSDYFLTHFAHSREQHRKKLDASAVKALKLHPWPGNVRELKDTVLYAAFHSKTDVISAADLNFSQSEPDADDSFTLRKPQKDKEKIIEAYRRSGSWTGAAKLLGISERALIEQRKKHCIGKKGEPEV